MGDQQLSPAAARLAELAGLPPDDPRTRAARVLGGFLGEILPPPGPPPGDYDFEAWGAYHMGNAIRRRGMALVGELLGQPPQEAEQEVYRGVDVSEKADARRFRWLVAGHGGFLEERCICLREDDEEAIEARALIDGEMKLE